MDGYAIRHADLVSIGETRLRIVGTALAGHVFSGKIGGGECVRIMTGAVVPDAADTIVMQEDVMLSGDSILVPAGQQIDQNIRRAGEDLKAGRPALHEGKLLRPAEIGLLASIGIAEVWVRRRIRVALFSTGDELQPIGSPLHAGEIYDSNRYTLWSMLTRLGCDVLDMGVVPDDPELIEAALRTAAANADAIITSGGVSVGDADYVEKLMAQLGHVAFWKIAMKPGRPMAFGRILGAWLFGLPGNPVAVMVTFYQFVRQALLQLSGIKPLEPVPTFPARCAERIRKGKGRTEYQRGILFFAAGEWQVRPTSSQSSGVLRSMTEANCFIVLESERGNVEEGEIVMVQPMDGLV